MGEKMGRGINRELALRRARSIEKNRYNRENVGFEEALVGAVDNGRLLLTAQSKKK